MHPRGAHTIAYMYLNKAFLFGNLTRDPEQKALPSGITVVNFSIATNRVFKDRDGKRQEMPEYHNIVVFGRQAEIVAQYLRKGSSVLVEGRIQTRSWDGQDGKKQYRTEIVADRIQFGPRPAGGTSSSAPATGGHAAQPSAPESMDMIDYPQEDNRLEDIPF